MQYVAKEYEKLVKQDKLYRNKKSYIPAPKFYVFYNGQEKQPEHWTEYLSQSFEKEETDPALELKVEFFNINSGMNEKLMQHCKTLSEYMQYVNMVRKNAMDMPLREAVNTAIDCCIKQGILSEFLRQNKAEVTAMSIFEYDEEREIELIRRDEREIGEQIGIEKERGRAQKELEQNQERTIQTIISLCRKHGDTREQTIQELCENCELTRDDAEKKMQLYWK